MKKILYLFVSVLIISTSVNADTTVYDDSYQENPNYLQGNKFLQSSQYTSAINEFKKALRSNPADGNALIGLSNAYNLRAVHYNNTVKDTDKAISDIKSALFFIKYYAQGSTSVISPQTLASIESNLKMLESSNQNSVTPEYRVQMAKKNRVKGEFAAAAYDYLQVVSVPKYSFEAYTSLGDIYKIFNRNDKAVSFYQKALSINSQDSDTHLKLARVYEQLNDFNSSLKEYDIALKNSTENEEILSSLERIWQKKVDEFPKDAEAHSNLGVVFQNQKRYSEALSEYKKAEELNPSNLNIKTNIGSLFQEQKKFENAINTYDSILMVQPYNVNVLIFKAECLKELKKYDDAVDIYKKALSIQPKNAQVKAELYELLKNTMSTEDVLAFLYKNVQNSPMDAESYYEFAYELHKSNKLDDAIVYYLETIKLDNNKIDAYVNLSQAYRQKKDFKNALAVMEKVKSIAPENEQVKEQYKIVMSEFSANKYTLALNAYESGDYPKAIEEYKLIQPATADSLIGIAASYQAMSNTPEAINYYKKAMELSPKNAEIPVYIASLYVNSNDNESAKKYIDIALSLNPNNSQAKELKEYLNDKLSEDLISKAVDLYEASKYNEAVTALDKIIATNAQNPTAYYYRALAYDGLNNYKKAIEDYKMTLKYAPDMIVAYYSMGVDYDTLNDFAKAKENYKLYVEKSTNDDEYRQYAQERVKEIN